MLFAQVVFNLPFNLLSLNVNPLRSVNPSLTTLSTIRSTKLSLSTELATVDLDNVTSDILFDSIIFCSAGVAVTFGLIYCFSNTLTSTLTSFELLSEYFTLITAVFLPFSE